jgi:hypothetical protein
MAESNISPLKKVSLSIADASGQGNIDVAKKHHFHFIYGAASDGLCPFEIQLADRYPGEVLDIRLNLEEIHDFFGHLFFTLKNSLNRHILPSQLHLLVAIDAVEQAEDSEIITAMKEYLGGSCGGSCGCGCH